MKNWTLQWELTFSKFNTLFIKFKVLFLNIEIEIWNYCFVEEFIAVYVIILFDITEKKYFSWYVIFDLDDFL